MNELLIVVALVLQIKAGSIIGTATGFFYVYGKDDVLYFVTNRHVVMDETRKVQPDFLRLKLHLDPDDLSKNVEVDVPLYSDDKLRKIPKWHEHKDYKSKKVDIAVIELDKKKFDHFFIKGLSAMNFLPKDIAVRTGEDVMLIGFPRGFSDDRHNLPLLRNAMISSLYGIDFNGVPAFLVDANLHPGMSGSPVLTKPRDILPDGQGSARIYKVPQTFFLGVFSATVNFKVSGDQKESLGLGFVWYGYLIEEVIESFTKNSSLQESGTSDKLSHVPELDLGVVCGKEFFSCR